MSIVPWDAVEEVYQNDTGPDLEYLFLQADGYTVRDLTGYAGWITFWYPGQPIHVVRAGLIVPLSGIFRYFFKGDEYPTVGTVHFQVTLLDLNPQAPTDSVPNYFATADHVITRTVIRRID